MIALLGAVLGFLTSIFPDLFKAWRAKQDNAHELAVLRLQMEAAAQGAQQHLDEVGIAAEQAMYVAAHAPQQLTGIDWVDALNASVRPVLAYAFFLLYAGVKAAIFFSLHGNTLPWQVEKLWTQDDAAIFAGIITFYFGSRAASRARQGK